MSEQWYVQFPDKVAGPFSTEQLEKLATSGNLKAKHKVSIDRKNWENAISLTNLKFAPASNASGLTAETIPVTCGCGQSWEVSAAFAGTKQKCPNCGQKAEVFSGAGYPPPSYGSNMRTGGINDLFDMGFKKFITPAVVKILYAFNLFLAILANMFVIYSFIQMYMKENWTTSQIGIHSLLLLMVFVGTALEILFVRMSLEGILIIFRIEEHLRKPK